MRELSGIDGNSPEIVLAGLRLALSGEGPAILPMATGGIPPVSGGQVPRTVAVVIETSGSTGVPKRVMLSTDALLAGAAASSAALGGPGQWLLALPTHYVAGVQVLVRSIAAETASDTDWRKLSAKCVRCHLKSCTTPRRSPQTAIR